MRSLKISVIAFILSFSLHSICFCDEEDFPKIGFIKNDGANIRAGDNINFQSLCTLKNGDPVKIMDERYSWYKIVLPKKAYLYIKNDFVDLTSKKDMGVVNGVNVNLRAGPGTRFPILGQISEPDELIVLSEHDGWYKIEPPKGTTGWIHKSQVMFSLK